MTRLKKTHVEALMRDYDRDAIGALTVALSVALNRPEGSWEDLLAAAAMSDIRRDRLRAGDPVALDELAAELNETRERPR